MQDRLRIAFVLLITASLLWLGIFRLNDILWRQDPGLTYSVWNTRLLMAAATSFVIVAAIVVHWFRLLPGRPVSALVIAIVFAILIPPATSTSPKTRRQLVAESRFYGFTGITAQYLAFVTSITIGCAVAMQHKRDTVLEQVAASKCP
jgi:hypothetical protein